MQVVILCGGKGTRAYPYTDSLPKPMLPVEGTPILMHVMRIFAAQGYRDFLLAAGHRQEVIRDYFDGKHLDWKVDVVDTGEETGTGGRIRRLAPRIEGPFFATYADGLSNVPLEALRTFHADHGAPATVTSVPLPSQYGTIDADDSGRVRGFREKPVLREHWINAGYFIFDPAVFDDWRGDDLEREVLPRMAADGRLYSYRFDGYFKSLDTYKDHQEIEQLLRDGQAPWKHEP